MNGSKTISLFSFFENGCRVQIQARLLCSGSFNNKGVLNIDPEHSLRSAKTNAKRRGMGFNLISLRHEGCGYHHVNHNDVVAIPLDIHAACSHALLDGSAFNLEGVLG